ncbi:MAG: Ig-like domain-containing protein [Candidatus Zixiibacteriota bacterium]
MACWVIASLSIVLPGHRGAAMAATASVVPGEWLAHGVYVGTGSATQSVSGLGFSPDLVIIRGDQNTASVIRTSSMPGDMAKKLGTNDPVQTGLITALDGDGFTVGNAPGINDLGIAYYWVALKATAGVLTVGSYTGDGIDNRSISGVGFSPSYAIVMGQGAEHAFQRFADQAVDRSIEFSNSADDGNRIQSFEADGFQVGKDNAVNKSLDVYHYAAFADSQGVLDYGSYTGDDQDNRDLILPGFAPAYLLVKQDGGESGVQRYLSQAGDAAFEFHRNPAFANAIQALLANGFQIGTDHVVNDGNKTYYYVAFSDFQSSAPVLDSIGPRSVNEGDNLSFMIAATDPDGDSITLSALGLPANASLTDNHDGTALFEFAPDSTQAGLYPVGFFASDGWRVDSEWITITVNNANRPPVWTPIGPQGIAEGETLLLEVTAGDPDNDPLTLQAVGLPPNAVFADGGDGNGTLTFVADYTQAGVYSVGFIVSDGALKDTESVTITVTNTNRPPVVAAIDTLRVNEGRELNLVVFASDPDGAKPSLTAENLPANATFVDHTNGTGKLEFDPDFSQAGIYHVLIIASDGFLSDTEIVVIIVGNASSPPLLAFIPDQLITEGAVLSIMVSATSPGGNPLSLLVEQNPANSSLTDHGDGTGSFEFHPDFTQAGIYTVRFIASDGTLADTAMPSITVLDSNRAPQWTPTPDQVTQEGQTLTFFVSATDPDGVVPSLTADNLPANAGFLDQGAGSGRFDFAPAYDQAGIYSIRFIASDGVAADTDDVLLTVGNVNRPPVIGPLGDRIVGVGQELVIDVLASDPDGTIPALSCPGTPLNATFLDHANGSGTFAFIPDASQLGEHYISFIATDGVLADTVTINTSVASTNLPPQWDPIGDHTVMEGQKLTFSVVAIDPEGSDPTLTVLGLPIHATFADLSTGTGQFSFDPSFTQAGSYSIRFVASDGALADTETVGITVLEAGNQRPELGVSGSLSTLVGGAIHLDVSATDPDEQALVLTALGVPAGASFVDYGNNTGDFDFGTGIGDVGTHFLTFIAFDGGLADTVFVALEIAPGAPASILIQPDSVIVSADSSQLFTITALDNDGYPTSPGRVTWSITAPLGEVDSTGLFVAQHVGVGRMVARSEFGPVDSTGYLEVIPGQVLGMRIDPDTAMMILGETRQFTVSAFDADGNAIPPGSLSWSVLGTMGYIDATGLFTATQVGAGRVIARRETDGIADTSGTINVSHGDMTRLIVTPDTASLRIGQTVAFAASGYTATYEPAMIGAVDWAVIGGIGTVDGAGLFTATAKGTGRLVATSAAGGISDTSNTIVVDVLVAEELPLGNTPVHAGESRVPVLAFALENRFATAKEITSIRVQDVSRGKGTTEQIRSNMAALSFYRDANGNGLFEPSDQRLGISPPSDQTTFGFSAISIPPVSRVAFFLTHDVAMAPRDGDSLDYAVIPATGIMTPDGGPVGGSDTVNSLGFSIVDGQTVDQIDLAPTGNLSVSPVDGVTHVMTLDLRRNGYQADVLEVISIRNSGTAGPADFDSVMCYLDTGSGMWDGAEAEQRLGTMHFTGGLWSISGLATPITAPSARLFVGVGISAFATDGATLSLGVPLHGIEMASNNDGPIDGDVAAVETISILSSQSVVASAIPIPATTLIPGESAIPVAGVSLINGLSTGLTLTALDCRLILDDPRGATLEELRSQIDSATLWLDRDNEIQSNGPPDSLIATAIPSGTAVHFELAALPIAGNGAQSRIAFCLHLDREQSRDGNHVNVAVDSEFDFEFAQPVPVSGSFPLKNPTAHTIDAFPLAGTTLHSNGGNSRFGGQSQIPILDFELPRAGYSTDVLTRLRVINRGSVEGSAVSAIALWADVDADGFDPQDQRIGALTRLAGEWRLDGVAVPLNQTRNRFILTVDIPIGLTAGGTLDLEIPVDGVLCVSGMDGPDDQPIRNNQPDLVFPSDRITVIATPRSGRSVNPGSTDNRPLLFALYNGYRTQAQTLTAVSFVNESRSSGGGEAADQSLGTVSLYRSVDSFGETGNDELVATGQFAEGRLRLAGMSQVFQPEQLSYFYVSIDVPLDVADGDSLAIGVDALSDFEFSGFVDINGDVPSGINAPLVIDGSVAAQYNVFDVGTSVLVGRQHNATLFAFKPARNGRLPDTLIRLNLSNEGTAGPDDLAAVTLWQDTDGDALFSDGDVPIAGLSHAAGVWNSGTISLPVNATTPGLIVTADIAGDASPEASVKFALPQDGCEYASGNDGPLDHALSSPRWLYISRGSLAASLDLDRTTYTVGQPVTATIEITNWLPNPIDDLVIRELGAGASGSIRLDSVSGGSAVIAPGTSATIRRFYTAAAPGSCALRYRAVTESLHDSSALVESPAIFVQSAPAPISLTLTSSIPAAVTRGQNNVFPLTIVLQNNSDPEAAPVRIESLTLSAQDFDRQPLSMAAVAKRLILTDDRRQSTLVEDIPNESGVEFAFAAPVLLNSNGTVRFSLLLDVADSARFGRFRLALTDPGALVIRDANTGLGVPFADGVAFPVSTSACRVLNPAANLAVSATSIVGSTANRGQTDVGLLRIGLSNVGDESSAQIMLTRLSCRFVGAGGSLMAPGELFSQVRLSRAGFALATISSPAATAGTLAIDLSAPLILSPGETEFVELHVSVDPQVTASGFRVVIPDSTAFVCRDLSSGLPRLAVSDALAAADSAVFPIRSAYTHLRDPAAPLGICLEATLPPSVISGSRGVALARLQASYPAHPAASPVVLNAVKFLALDTLGRVLDPLSLFDRVGYRIDGGPIQYLSAFGLSQGAVDLVIPGDELRLEPGNETVVELIADLESDAPYDHFLISISDPGSFSGYDGTDANVPLVLAAGDQCELSWPFSTGAAGIILPAGRPALHLASGPANLAPLGAGVNALEGRIDYTYGESQGTLLLDRLAIHLTKRDASSSAAFPFAAVFESLTLLAGGDPVVAAISWQSDLVTLDISPPIPIAHGGILELTISGVVSAQAPVGNYAVSLLDSTAVVLRDAELGATAYVVTPDGPFPLRGTELSVAAPDLAASFTTFPNPFNPLLEESATVGYVLPADAEVDITIYSITGGIVRRLAERLQQAAGAHNSERWDGRNDGGDLVVPGTYFCQLRAVLSTSATQTHRRKVVVLR